MAKLEETMEENGRLWRTMGDNVRLWKTMRLWLEAEKKTFKENFCFDAADHDG